MAKRIRFRAGLQQCIDARDAAGAGGEHERGSAEGIGGIDRGTALDQESDGIRFPRAGRAGERPPAKLIA